MDVPTNYTNVCDVVIQLLQLDSAVFSLWQEKKSKYGFICDSKFAGWLLNLTDRVGETQTPSQVDTKIEPGNNSNKILERPTPIDRDGMQKPLMIDESLSVNDACKKINRKRRKLRTRKYTKSLPNAGRRNATSTSSNRVDGNAVPIEDILVDEVPAPLKPKRKRGRPRKDDSEKRKQLLTNSLKIHHDLSTDNTIGSISHYGLRKKPKKKVFGDDIHAYHTLDGRHIKVDEKAADLIELIEDENDTPTPKDDDDDYDQSKLIRCNICSYKHRTQQCDRHCAICNKTFPVPSKYKLHAASVHVTDLEKTKYKCPHCFDKGFRLKEYLKLHIKTCHNEQRKHVCNFCDNVFVTERHLVIHKARFHGQGEIFPCNMCRTVFTDAGLLTSHKQEIHAKLHFQCNVCHKMLATKSALNRHITNKHRSEVHMCDICGKTFSCKFYLRGHKTRQHLNATGTLKCTECTKEFRTTVALTSHFKASHQKVRYQCTVCFKLYSSKQSFQMHIASEHYGTQDHQCNICQKVFKHPHKLKTHLANVHKEKTFACSFCDKMFRVSSQLKRHLQLSHSNLRKFQCGLCGKLFSVKSHVVQHLQQVHHVDKQSIEVKNDPKQQQPQQQQLQQQLQQRQLQHLQQQQQLHEAQAQPSSARTTWNSQPQVALWPPQ